MKNITKGKNIELFKFKNQIELFSSSVPPGTNATFQLFFAAETVPFSLRKDLSAPCLPTSNYGKVEELFNFQIQYWFKKKFKKKEMKKKSWYSKLQRHEELFEHFSSSYPSETKCYNSILFLKLLSATFQIFKHLSKCGGRRVCHVCQKSVPNILTC